MDERKVLEQLISAYDAVHGQGSGHEIMGGLMFSHGYSGIIDVFKKAKERKIVLLNPEDIIDGVIIKYVKTKSNEKA